MQKLAEYEAQNPSQGRSNGSIKKQVTREKSLNNNSLKKSASFILGETPIEEGEIQNKMMVR